MSDAAFDYIVIGGGAAGAVIAHRLSERSGNSVLLLEAGPDTPPEQVPPEVLDAFPSVAYFKPEYHWRDLRVHYERLDRNELAEFVPRRYEQAKIMGGGSSINGMLAIRGLPWDFEEWVRRGADGWSFEEVLPFYKKLERDCDYDGPLHGKKGRIPIRRIFPDNWPGFAGAVREAMLLKGYRWFTDHNADPGDGCFPMAINNLYGQRVSTAIAYLDPVTRQRPNLRIQSLTRVRELLWDGRRIVGVTALREGRVESYRAGTVIVSAGALHSPAILLRAGIGPGDHMRRFGITPRVDRPGVGRGLQDHPMVALCAHTKPGARMPSGMRRHIHLGLRYSSGLAGSPAGDMFAIVNNRGGWHPLGHALGSIIVCINKPYSSGRVELASPSPDDEPRVLFNQLSDERDRIRLADALRLAYGLMDTPPVRACTDAWFPTTFSEKARDLAIVSGRNWLSTKLLALLLDGGPAVRRKAIDKLISPGVDIDRLVKDQQRLEQWVMEKACGSWHAAGTCRIGGADDPIAVVDPHGRVHGVDGLLVADASIMPCVVSANTNLTTIMIGEKIAHHVLTTPVN